MSDFRIRKGTLEKYTGNGGDVVIPDSVTCIGYEAFSGCTGLTGITIPDSVTSIDNKAFYGCTGLTGITIPDSVTRIGERAFYCCTGLTGITIPDSVTRIGDEAFCGCTGLTGITIPNSVTSIEGSWNGGTFRGCTGLTGITIPDSVKSIGERAFEGCTGLTSITIPDSVTYIDKRTFCDCTGLTNIFISGFIATELNDFLPKTDRMIFVHVPDISDVTSKYRPNAAIAFADDNRDCTDETGKAYLKYIKSNAAKLVDAAMQHPALFYLMIREKLITAKDLEAFSAAVQATGNTEMIAAMLEYANTNVSEKDKAKAHAKKEERETNVTNFVFDAEKLETVSGKTFVVTGKLKTFTSRAELKECLETAGGILTETLNQEVDYLITNTPDSGTAKNKLAVELGVKRITEAQFNKMVGRNL